MSARHIAAVVMLVMVATLAIMFRYAVEPIHRGGAILVTDRWTGRTQVCPMLKGVNHNLMVPDPTCMVTW